VSSNTAEFYCNVTTRFSLKQTNIPPSGQHHKNVTIRQQCSCVLCMRSHMTYSVCYAAYILYAIHYSSVQGLTKHPTSIDKAIPVHGVDRSCLRAPGGSGFLISKSSAHEGGKVVRWIMVRKIPMTSLGIDPAYFRLIVQCPPTYNINTAARHTNNTTAGRVKLPLGRLT
jgi:hypothetical protein